MAKSLDSRSLSLPDPHPTEEQLDRLNDVIETYEMDLLGPPPFDN